MATAVVVNQPYFDEFGQQYKCCCRSCHVKTGTLVIGILSAIGIVLSLFQNGVGMTNAAGGLKSIFVVQVVVFGLQGIAVVCLFIGWAMENRHLLIPYMTVQILAMVLVVALAIFFLVLLFVGGDLAVKVIAALSNRGSKTSNMKELKAQLKGMTSVVCIFMIVLYMIVLAIQIWLFTVVLACFRFFRDKKEFSSHHGGHPNVQYAAQPQNVQYAAQPQAYPAYPQPYGQQPEPTKYGY